MIKHLIQSGTGRSWALRLPLLITAIAGGLFLTACEPTGEPSSSRGTTDAQNAERKLKIVATTNYVADVVQAVVGNHAEVILLMGPGTDPHLYKPSAADVPLLRSADAIFYNGLMLEGKLDSILAQMQKGGKPIAALAESLPNDRLIHPAAFEGHPDPHIWNDPDLWSQTPAVVAKVMGELLPNHRGHFIAAATDYSDKITATGGWARERLAELAKEQRVLITSHDAFNYLGRSFEIEVYAPQGISTTSQAGLADIAETVELIKKRGIKAIFVESSVSPQVIERIAAQSGAQVGGELFSDAMGAPGETRTVHGETFDVGSYEGVMKYNISTIVEALK